MAKQAKVLPIWIKVKVKGLQVWTNDLGWAKGHKFRGDFTGYVNEEGSYMELNTHISGAKNGTMIVTRYAPGRYHFTWWDSDTADSSTGAGMLERVPDSLGLGQEVYVGTYGGGDTSGRIFMTLSREEAATEIAE